MMSNRKVFWPCPKCKKTVATAYEDDNKYVCDKCGLDLKTYQKEVQSK